VSKRSDLTGFRRLGRWAREQVVHFLKVFGYKEALDNENRTIYHKAGQPPISITKHVGELPPSYARDIANMLEDQIVDEDEDEEEQHDQEE
jgi:hypothetical protein